MTDPAPRPAARRRVARVPTPSVTAAGASIVFLGALGGMGVQMAAGHDPALGATKPAASVPRVVTGPAPAATPAVAAPSPAAAPVVRTSAPAPVAAAPAPPAPVQTASS